MYKSQFRTKIAGCSLIALCTALPPVCAAWAAPPTSGVLQEVVITAEKRTENVQKAAIAVDVLRPQDLRKAGVTNVLQLQDVLPAVKIVTAAVNNFSIRGLGTAVNTSQADSAVALSVDGIYLSHPNGLSPVMYDMARVEVVLGPQGTLYGRNSNAGVINFITNDPVFKYGGHAQVGFGNYGAVTSDSAINIPLSDVLAVRIAEGSERHNAYDSDGQNSKDAVGGRMKILYKPNSDFDALLSVDAIHSLWHWDPYDGVCPPGSFNVACGAGRKPNWSGFSPGPITADHTQNDGFGTSLKLEDNLGWANLISLTGYRTYNYLSTNQPQTENGMLSQTFNVYEADRFVTQEVRLSSEAGSKITWVGGVYYSHEDQRNATRFDYYQGNFVGANIFQNFPITIESQSEAVFGDVTVPVPLIDGLRLRAGVRYTHETKDANGFNESGTLSTRVVDSSTPTQGSESIWRATWKAGVDYDVTPNNLLYFTASTGFKSGGLNNVPAAADSILHYAPEFITAEEIGSKNRFFDNRLQLNLAAFNYSYRNYQTFVFWRPDAGLGAPSSIAGGTFFPFVNSQKATFRGGELDANWRITPYDKLGLSFNYLDDVYNVFNLVLPYSPPPQSLSNTQVPQAPRTTFTPQFEHDFSFTNGDALAFNVESQIVSSQIAQGSYTDNVYSATPRSYTYRQPAYHKTDVSLTYTTAESGWTFNAYIRNIENVAVINRVSDGYPQMNSYPYLNYALDDPRTFGFTVRKDF